MATWRLTVNGRLECATTGWPCVHEVLSIALHIFVTLSVAAREETSDARRRNCSLTCRLRTSPTAFRNVGLPKSGRLVVGTMSSNQDNDVIWSASGDGRFLADHQLLQHHLLLFHPLLTFLLLLKFRITKQGKQPISWDSSLGRDCNERVFFSLFHTHKHTLCRISWHIPGVIFSESTRISRDSRRFFSGRSFTTRAMSAVIRWRATTTSNEREYLIERENQKSETTAVHASRGRQRSDCTFHPAATYLFTCGIYRLSVNCTCLLSRTLS